MLLDSCLVNRCIIMDTTLKHQECNAEFDIQKKMTPQEMLDFIMENTKIGCKIFIFMHTDDCFLFIDAISYLSEGKVEYHSWNSSSKYKNIDIGILVRVKD